MPPMPLMNPKKQSKALYDACVGKDWEAAIALCNRTAKSKGTANSKAPYQDDHGRTCLHEAVEKKAPCRVVRAILDAHKGRPVRITRLTDKRETTALHVAAAVLFGCSHNEAAVLKMLVESDPHCATMPDDRGFTPLHNIVMFYSREDDETSAIRVECICALLNASTAKSILSLNSYKNTALHIACSSSETTPKIVQVILEHCPRAAFSKDGDGNTPLHFVVRNDIHGDIYDFNRANIIMLLESLTTLSQPGAAAVNKFGQTPLHFAVRCADNNAIKLLVGLRPETVYIKDKNGKIPLDCVQEVYAQNVRVQWYKQDMTVCSRPDSGSFFKDICERCNLLVEAMLSVRHRRNITTGGTSLWMTTEQKSSTNEECFEYALIHNYLRLGSECPLDFLLDLNELYPHQTQTKDARGDLPLHIALENGVQHAKRRSYLSFDRNTFGVKSNSVINALIGTYPQAARIPNRNGDLPFHILLQNRADTIGWHHNVQPLLRANPAALLYGETDFLPMLLPWILSRVGRGKALSALYEFVREMPLLCFEVTETTDLVSERLYGIRALHIE